MRVGWISRFNFLVYRVAYRLGGQWIALRSRRWIRAALGAEGFGETRAAGVLLLAWGRIGDVLLELPLIRGLRRLFPDDPLVCLGRGETGALLQGEVDRFLPFSAKEWMRSDRYRRDLVRELARPWNGLIGDLHLFHGGLFYLQELLERIPARFKAHYQGHGLELGLAPWRPVPSGTHLVPSRRVPADADPGIRHMWHEGQYYLAALHALLGREPPVPGPMGPLPSLLAEAPGSAGALLERLGLEPGGFVACQPASSNPRKDYPLERWRRLWAAFPGERFVLLGNTGEARMEECGPGRLDLRGRTTLEEAVHVLRSCRAFVGLDSGLTHLAAHLGRPTLCLARASGLGFFFPYPRAMGSFALRVLHDSRFEECAGCLATCRREPFWRTCRHGALCLRELPVEEAIEGLAALLGRSVPEKGPELGV